MGGVAHDEHFSQPPRPTRRINNNVVVVVVLIIITMIKGLHLLLYLYIFNLALGLRLFPVFFWFFLFHC